jgi:hypothetical protein
MRPFTYKEYIVVQVVYEELMDIASSLRADSSEEEWDRYDNVQHLYQYELYHLIGESS